MNTSQQSRSLISSLQNTSPSLPPTNSLYNTPTLRLNGATKKKPESQANSAGNPSVESHSNANTSSKTNTTTLETTEITKKLDSLLEIELIRKKSTALCEDKISRIYELEGNVKQLEAKLEARETARNLEIELLRQQLNQSAVKIDALSTKNSDLQCELIKLREAARKRELSDQNESKKTTQISSFEIELNAKLANLDNKLEFLRQHTEQKLTAVNERIALERVNSETNLTRALTEMKLFDLNAAAMMQQSANVGLPPNVLKQQQQHYQNLQPYLGDFVAVSQTVSSCVGNVSGNTIQKGGNQAPLPTQQPFHNDPYSMASINAQAHLLRSNQQQQQAHAQQLSQHHLQQQFDMSNQNKSHVAHTSMKVQQQQPVAPPNQNQPQNNPGLFARFASNSPKNVDSRIVKSESVNAKSSPSSSTLTPNTTINASESKTETATRVNVTSLSSNSPVANAIKSNSVSVKSGGDASLNFSKSGPPQNQAASVLFTASHQQQRMMPHPQQFQVPPPDYRHPNATQSTHAVQKTHQTHAPHSPIPPPTTQQAPSQKTPPQKPFLFGGLSPSEKDSTPTSTMLFGSGAPINQSAATSNLFGGLMSQSSSAGAGGNFNTAAATNALNKVVPLSQNGPPTAFAVTSSVAALFNFGGAASTKPAQSSSSQLFPSSSGTSNPFNFALNPSQFSTAALFAPLGSTKSPTNTANTPSSSTTTTNPMTPSSLCVTKSVALLAGCSTPIQSQQPASGTLLFGANQNASNASSFGGVAGQSSLFVFNSSFATPTTRINSVSQNEESEDGGAHHQLDEEQENSTTYKPVVEVLPDVVEKVTGEESETCLFEARAILYWFRNKEWKERGRGLIKMLQSGPSNQNATTISGEANQKTRILMRRDQVFKTCCNHFICAGMRIEAKTQGAGRMPSLSWAATDYSEPPPEDENVQSTAEKSSSSVMSNSDGPTKSINAMFTVKFKLQSEADEFRRIFETAASTKTTKKETSGYVEKDDLTSKLSNAKQEKPESASALKEQIKTDKEKQQLQNEKEDSEATTEDEEGNALIKYCGEAMKASNPTIKGALNNQTIKPQSGFLNESGSNENHHWQNAGQQLFGAAGASGGTAGDEHDNDVSTEKDPDPQFEPIVPLPSLIEKKVDESEECVWKHRAKLFKYDSELNEWKERGLGDMKIMRRRENNQCRMLMLRDQVHKLCCNQLIGPVTPKFEPMPNSETSMCWMGQDFSEYEMECVKFAIKFKTKDVLQEFTKQVDIARNLKNDSD